MFFNRCYMQMSVATMFTLCSLANPVAAQDEYDDPGPIPARDIIPSYLLSGKGFKVTESANADGMLCSFSLWTPQGWYRPQSAAMLEIRVTEARAMAALDSMREDPMFLEGLTDQAGDTIRATGQAIRQPIKTLRGIPMGLEKMGTGIQSRANQGKVTGEDGKLIYMRAKRALAADLGIDPYSSNEQLQQLLNTVAASRNAGALTGRIAGAMVGGGTGAFISAAQLNRNLQSKLRDQSAPELQKANAMELHRLGCGQQEIDSFLKQKNYTATYCTAITDLLMKLADVDGCRRYLSFIKPATTPEVAVYYHTQIAMATGFHLKKQPLARFDSVSDTAVFSDRNGGKHLFVPIDYLMWTPVAEKRLRGLGKTSKLDLWITGTATPKAKAKLEKYGVTLHENIGKMLLDGTN